ncbi:hypothetical protein METHB2_490024 [Candidatus Methylobacter favarea]|uniref:Uncharacterized protein n=1 Tax=Candidatus Methylobacter favarea TaxID=2707345 RepID=A0A8S0WK50_9GAMM|nr:hypothetical protein [Candidatus Methylobacter favarea]CAA9891718.1 hypothetical protein METHB2_490024 [Candidatus Methylobacter favarea]
MKTNIQDSKTNRKKLLNLKKTRYSRALKQYQFIDSSYSSITRLKGVALFTVLTLGLMSKPYLAHADKNSVTSSLQTVAKSYAQELGDVLAQDHWTRIEFSTIYIDPVVVVEGLTANADNPYVVGIRNVDEMGFEIRFKSCANSNGIPVQEKVNYSVIEKSKLPLTEDANAKVRQQFSWGQCATPIETQDITTGRVS